jgi:hypothetical protein
MRLRTADVLTAKITVNRARVLHLLLQQLEIGAANSSVIRLEVHDQRSQKPFAVINLENRVAKGSIPSRLADRLRRPEPLAPTNRRERLLAGNPEILVAAQNQRSGLRAGVRRRGRRRDSCKE